MTRANKIVGTLPYETRELVGSGEVGRGPALQDLGCPVVAGFIVKALGSH